METGVLIIAPVNVWRKTYLMRIFWSYTITATETHIIQNGKVIKMTVYIRRGNIDRLLLYGQSVVVNDDGNIDYIELEEDEDEQRSDK